MTTPTTTPDKITPAELRAEFESLHAELAQLRADLTAVRDGLTQASQPAPQLAGQTATFTADAITLDYMDGKPVYKLKGGQYAKFGVRVWPEVLPSLGIVPDALKPGQNPIQPVTVRVLLVESTDENGQTKTTARKVTGKA